MGESRFSLAICPKSENFFGVQWEFSQIMRCAERKSHFFVEILSEIPYNYSLYTTPIAHHHGKVIK